MFEERIQANVDSSKKAFAAVSGKDISDLRDQMAEWFSICQARMADQDSALRNLRAEITAQHDFSIMPDELDGGIKLKKDRPSAASLKSECDSISASMAAKLADQAEKHNKDLQDLGELVLGEIEVLRRDYQQKLHDLGSRSGPA